MYLEYSEILVFLELNLENDLQQKSIYCRLEFLVFRQVNHLRLSHVYLFYF